jgi:predicted amidohydrolase YtcJ
MPNLASGTADLIITNARAWTLDPSNPRADTVAVKGDRILYVGAEEEAAPLRGPETEVIDGEGRTLLPGLIDSHFHLLWGSLRLDDLQLDGVRGFEALGEAIRTYTAAHPEHAWLSAQGLSYDVLPGERLTREHLDALEPHRPMVLTCFDFHTAWCNTAALKAAGILHGAEVPSNAEVVLGDDGLATGELREFEAMDLVYRLLPEPSPAEVRDLLRRGMRLANAYGITSVHNMNGDRDEFAHYRALDEAGELSVRLYVPFRMYPHTPLSAIETEAVAMRDLYRSAKLRAGALKLFMDGVVESYTAFLTEPYANAPGCGEAIFSAEHAREIAVRADRAGLQIAVHAVGDAAVQRALDAFAAARRENGPRDARHRIEHIELLHPSDTHRFAALGVTASVQPLHCTRPELGYLPSWLAFIPPARYADAFPWGTLRAAGAHLSFGSDWPVVSMNPFLGFDAAVNRQPWAEGLPTQAQTLEATLAAYTRDAAFTELMEHDKGQLKAGMLADLVLLNADVFALPSEHLSTLTAALTVCGGEVVHRG